MNECQVKLNTHIHNMERWAECFSWLADMAEDPSSDGILKPHHQHTWDPRNLKLTPVSLSHGQGHQANWSWFTMLQRARDQESFAFVWLSDLTNHALDWG